MKKQYLWKFLLDGMKSSKGGCVWKIGEWKKEKKAITCSKGFHASTRIIDALSYVQGSILAHVEVRGECDEDHDKESWTEMRVVKAYKWTRKDSVKLAVYCAELVIDIFEKEHPDDKRPREAIEAAKAWLLNPNEQTAYAASAAAVASAAAKAAYAADAAACAANAAYAAYAVNAAYAAANAVVNAVNAVNAAYAVNAVVNAAYAVNATKIEIKNKIEKWLLNHVKELEEIK